MSLKRRLFVAVLGKTSTSMRGPWPPRRPSRRSRSKLRCRS